MNELNRIDNSLGEKRLGTFKSKTLKIGWNSKCEEVMSILKDRLISAPILGIDKCNVPFILEIDASNVGLGAVLSQQIEGRRVVIAYASKISSKG